MTGWWITTIALAAVWLVFMVALYARRRMRGPDLLTYDWRPPEQQRTMGQVMNEFGRSFEALAWGSSLHTWRLRCDASLHASRRRRGL